MRFVVSSDWDLLMAAFVEETDVSFSALVFLMMTWQRGDFGPTVVALWIDSLRAMVPVAVRLLSARFRCLKRTWFAKDSSHGTNSEPS